MRKRVVEEAPSNVDPKLWGFLNYSENTMRTEVNSSVDAVLAMLLTKYGKKEISGYTLHDLTKEQVDEAIKKLEPIVQEKIKFQKNKKPNFVLDLELAWHGLKNRFEIERIHGLNPELHKVTLYDKNGKKLVVLINTPTILALVFIALTDPAIFKSEQIENNFEILLDCIENFQKQAKVKNYPCATGRRDQLITCLEGTYPDVVIVKEPSIFALKLVTEFCEEQYKISIESNEMNWKALVEFLQTELAAESARNRVTDIKRIGFQDFFSKNSTTIQDYLKKEFRKRGLEANEETNANIIKSFLKYKNLEQQVFFVKNIENKEIRNLISILEFSTENSPRGNAAKVIINQLKLNKNSCIDNPEIKEYLALFVDTVRYEEWYYKYGEKMKSLQAHDENKEIFEFSNSVQRCYENIQSKPHMPFSDASALELKRAIGKIKKQYEYFEENRKSVSFIENIFALWTKSSTPEQKAIYFQLIHHECLKEKLTDYFLDKHFFNDGEMVDIIKVNPYIVNLVLLNALLFPVHSWSRCFFDCFERVLDNFEKFQNAHKHIDSQRSYKYFSGMMHLSAQLYYLKEYYLYVYNKSNRKSEKPTFLKQFYFPLREGSLYQAPCHVIESLLFFDAEEAHKILLEIPQDLLVRLLGAGFSYSKEWIQDVFEKEYFLKAILERKDIIEVIDRIYGIIGKNKHIYEKFLIKLLSSAHSDGLRDQLLAKILPVLGSLEVVEVISLLNIMPSEEIKKFMDHINIIRSSKKTIHASELLQTLAKVTDAAAMEKLLTALANNADLILDCELKDFLEKVPPYLRNFVLQNQNMTISKAGMHSKVAYKEILALELVKRSALNDLILKLPDAVVKLFDKDEVVEIYNDMNDRSKKSIFLRKLSSEKKINILESCASDNSPDCSIGIIVDEISKEKDLSGEDVIKVYNQLSKWEYLRTEFLRVLSDENKILFFNDRFKKSCQENDPIDWHEINIIFNGMKDKSKLFKKLFSIAIESIPPAENGFATMKNYKEITAVSMVNQHLNYIRKTNFVSLERAMLARRTKFLKNNLPNRKELLKDYADRIQTKYLDKRYFFFNEARKESVLRKIGSIRELYAPNFGEIKVHIKSMIEDMDRDETQNWKNSKLMSILESITGELDDLDWSDGLEDCSSEADLRLHLLKKAPKKEKESIIKGLSVDKKSQLKNDLFEYYKRAGNSMDDITNIINNATIALNAYKKPRILFGLFVVERTFSWKFADKIMSALDSRNVFKTLYCIEKYMKIAEKTLGHMDNGQVRSSELYTILDNTKANIISELKKNPESEKALESYTEFKEFVYSSEVNKQPAIVGMRV